MFSTLLWAGTVLKLATGGVLGSIVETQTDPETRTNSLNMFCLATAASFQPFPTEQDREREKE